METENEILETEEQVIENNTESIPEPFLIFSLADYDTFKSNAFRYDVTDSVRCIEMHMDDEEITYKFYVPQDYYEYIKVVDGMIYNFSSETVQLTSLGTNLSSACYYFKLEIPPYGSEQYFERFLDTFQYTQNQGYPYALIGVESMDGEITEITYHPTSQENYRFSEVGSSMAYWPIETIFLFIILIILIGKNIFRKG